MLGIYCRTSKESESSIEQQKKLGIAFATSNKMPYQVYIEPVLLKWTDRKYRSEFEEEKKHSTTVEMLEIETLESINNDDNIDVRLQNITKIYKALKPNLKEYLLTQAKILYKIQSNMFLGSGN